MRFWIVGLVSLDLDCVGFSDQLDFIGSVVLDDWNCVFRITGRGFWIVGLASVDLLDLIFRLTGLCSSDIRPGLGFFGFLDLVF